MPEPLTIAALTVKLQDAITSAAKDVVIAQLIALVQQPIANLDAKVSDLIQRPFGAGIDLLRRGKIDEAQEQFLPVANTRSNPELAAQARFFVGVCDDLLGRRSHAAGSYEQAFRMAIEYEAVCVKYAERRCGVALSTAGAAMLASMPFTFLGGMFAAVVLLPIALPFALAIGMIAGVLGTKGVVFTVFEIGKMINDRGMKPVNDFHSRFTSPLSRLVVARGHSGQLDQQLSISASGAPAWAGS